MPGFFIIAHAPLASALKSVAAHTFPEQACLLETLDVMPAMSPEEIEELARAAILRVCQPDALIFTDVFGATPCNVAQRLVGSMAETQIKVIAGVNVPMLWRTLSYADESLERLVARAVAGATQGVMQVTISRPQYQTLKAAGNDQDHRHHQQ